VDVTPKVIFDMLSSQLIEFGHTYKKEFLLRMRKRNMDVRVLFHGYRVVTLTRKSMGHIDASVDTQSSLDTLNEEMPAAHSVTQERMETSSD